MDIISHILIGKIISFFGKKTKRAGLWAMSFSFLPDLSQIPFYIILGYESASWNGARALHPFLTALWEIPHSFLFLFLIILPAIIFLKLPKIAFFAYFLHLLIDLPTHSNGEWAIKPFYPFNYTFSGFTDAWAWPFSLMLASWIILLIIIFLIHDKSFHSN